ncbi:hypothetical protein QUB08_30125 [Microcoleus sp. BR0-C5]|uniref:hypothetical protein n=1 Tax=Microcoleus sp. BR0-C5 TaxID=2818713 RepID=UPI002FD503DE
MTVFPFWFIQAGALPPGTSQSLSHSLGHYGSAGRPKQLWSQLIVWAIVWGA